MIEIVDKSTEEDKKNNVLKMVLKMPVDFITIDFHVPSSLENIVENIKKRYE